MLTRHSVHHTKMYIIPMAAMALAVTVEPALAKETYLLQVSCDAGDVAEYEETSNMNITFTVSSPTETVPPMLFTKHGRERYREEILALNNGNIDGLRRTYTIKREHQTMTDSPPKTTVSSLQGKTVAVRRRNGRLIVTVAKGNIAVSERKQLVDSLNEGPKSFFPDHKVAIGEEWKLPNKSLAKSFSNTDSVTVTGKLIEFVTYNDQRCARVQVALSMTSKLDGPNSKVTIKAIGDLYLSMDTQRILSVNMEDPISTNVVEEGANGKMIIQGTGTMKMQIVNNWIKIAGKSVTAESVITQ